MSKGRFFCGGSALAVTLAMTLGVSPSLAFAQPPVAQTPPAADAQPPEDDVDATEVEEIVSTGTFIRGTAEDAALPVEVIGRADLLAQGNPTMEELVRNLSEIGLVQSQSARGSNAGGIGVSSLNLRNFGSGRTLVTLNGRRLADDPNTNSGAVSVTGGAQQNINAIPTGALQQVEILKDSGGAAFGSDAVAGVVNFITRRDLNGTELDVRYKYTEGSDGGDYDATLRWGRRNDLGNILLSFEYAHVSPVEARDLEIIQRGLDLGFGQSIGLTLDGDVGSYQFVLPGSPIPNAGVQTAATQAAMQGTLITPGGTGNARYQGGPASASFSSQGIPGATLGATQSTSQLFPVMSGSGLLRDDACLAIGGYKTFSATPSPVCAHRRADEEDIQYGVDTFRFYGDMNFDLTEKVRYHAEILFNKQVTHIRGQDNGAGPGPCDPLPSGAPALAGTPPTGSPPGTVTYAEEPRRCTAPNFGAVGAAYSVPGYNPAVFDYMVKSYTNPINGTAPQRVFTDIQISSISGQSLTGAYTPTALSALSTDRLTVTGAPGVAGAQTGAAVTQGYNPIGFGRINMPTSTTQPLFSHSLPGFKNGEVPYKNESLLFRTTQQLKGDLGEVFGTVIDYDLSATYSRNMTRLYGSGMLVDRLQRGLNGFASNLDDLGSDGLGCGAEETLGDRIYVDVDGTSAVAIAVPYTRGAGGGADYNTGVAGNQRAANGFDPGTSAGNGCYFVNPFASAITKSHFNGKQPVASATDVGFMGGPSVGGTVGDYQGYTPGYGLANSAGVIRWLFKEREDRVSSDTVNIDTVFNGQVPSYELPGGPISWALGGQMRYVNRVADQDGLTDRRINPCPFIRFSQLGVSSDNNIINSTSTCAGSTAGVYNTAIGSTGSPFREIYTYAAFTELSLPITDRWNMQLIVRNERTKLPANDIFIGETVFSGSTKYQITDQLSVHASVAEHFDSPTTDDVGQDVALARNTGANFYTGVAGSAVNQNSANVSINNVDLLPETGTNWSVGLDFQSPDRRWNASLDFYSITITGRPTTVTASTLARAILGIRTASATIDPSVPIDCAAALGGGTVADLFDPDFSPSLFGGRPFIEFIDDSGVTSRGCRNGATLSGFDASGGDTFDRNNGVVGQDGNPYNDPGDLGLVITSPNRVNAGAEKGQGLEAGLSYRVPEQIYGGNLSLDLDLTLNLVKRREDVKVFGINVTAGSDDIGTLPPDLFAITQVLRGSIGARYVRGRHMFNLRGVYVGSFADGQGIAFSSFNTPGHTTTNVNPANPATCLAVGLPNAAQPIPIGFGSDTLGPLLVGDQPWDPNCRLGTNRGVKVGNSFIVGATWRWELPQDVVWGLDDTTLVVSVDNLLDRNPPYWRSTFHYIPFGSVTPYGRQVAVSLNKKF